MPYLVLIQDIVLFTNIDVSEITALIGWLLIVITLQATILLPDKI